MGLFATRGETTGRVREQCRHHSLASEPDVRVSPHPAQAAAKPRVSGAGLHDGLNPCFTAMDAELLVECTLHQIRLPLWVKRVGLLPDFYMAPDFGFAGIHQAQPNRLAVRTQLDRKSTRLNSSH